jgi:hypothetical protein
MLSEHESFDRYWFALCADGQLARVGDYGDYEAADEAAEDMGLEVIWLVCGNDAARWADTINSVRGDRGMKFPTPKWMDEGEAKVIRDMLTAAESRGYQVTVIDSIESDGERVVSRSSDYAEARANLFYTDSALLIFWDGKIRLGWVSLIFSNGSPEEVISDHADRPEIYELMPEVEA